MSRLLEFAPKNEAKRRFKALVKGNAKNGTLSQDTVMVSVWLRGAADSPMDRDSPIGSERKGYSSPNHAVAHKAGPSLALSSSLIPRSSFSIPRTTRRLSSDFGLMAVKTVCDERRHPTLTCLDDKCLYVSCWGAGEFRRLKRLPERLTLDSVLQIDGIARKAPHPSSTGSRDQRRSPDGLNGEETEARINRKYRNSRRSL